MKKNQTAVKKQYCCELTSLESTVLGEIFKAILKSGRTPSIEGMGLRIKKSESDVIRILDKLEEKDLLVRRRGTQQIVSIYPFSLIPTKHQVVLDNGKKLFAMCAVDALGTPNMFDRNVEVMSRCEWCKEKITIKIENGKIMTKSHPHVLIWNVKEQEGPDADTCCPMINFYCSPEHLKAWAIKNPDLSKNGCAKSLEDAYPDIKERWKYYGGMMRTRSKKG